ncbi:MAG TPA: hypothetical protein DHW78_00585 [Ruminococcaceae bacterium]|nr:hypothetical protein [Oscillospiraceae bacterium]
MRNSFLVSIFAYLFVIRFRKDAATSAKIFAAAAKLPLFPSNFYIITQFLSNGNGACVKRTGAA